MFVDPPMDTVGKGIQSKQVPSVSLVLQEGWEVLELSYVTDQDFKYIGCAGPICNPVCDVVVGGLTAVMERSAATSLFAHSVNLDATP